MEQLTQHAAARMQQRGIKEQTLECLFEFGSKTHDHKGGVVVFFDKQARKRLQGRFGKDGVRQMESQMDAYAVISQRGDVVTVGHRTKRINRH
ncbi:MAG: hypothetical protein ABI475_08830 [Methylophilaceae bacterium]